MEPIARKISVICPYLITAKHLRRWPPFVVYTLYSYLGEIFVLLAGFGIANPVMAFLAGGQNSTATTPKPAGSVVGFLGGSWTGWVALALLILWGLLKFYIVRSDLEKRCSLLKSYRRQCAQFDEQVRVALRTPNPMPELVQIQTKLERLVDTSIVEQAIPDDPVNSRYDAETEKYCRDLITKHRENWTDLPQDQQRREAVAPAPYAAPGPAVRPEPLSPSMAGMRAAAAAAPPAPASATDH